MVSNSMQMCNCEQVTETRKSLNQRMSCELPNNTKTYFNNTNRAELMYCFITVCLLRAPYYNVDRSLILWQLSLYRASSIVYSYQSDTSAIFADNKIRKIDDHQQCNVSLFLSLFILICINTMIGMDSLRRIIHLILFCIN